MNRKVCMGIVAHVDAGKTTLSESLLYACGAIKQKGRVDNKDTFLDTDEQEKARGITIFSKVARLKYCDTEIVLVDTPGHTDFAAEMERTLAILDIAVIIVADADRVAPHTKTLWRLLKRYNVPAVVFVNKMDMPSMNKEHIAEMLSAELDGSIVDFTAVMDCCEGFRESEGETDAREGFDTLDAAYEQMATCSESLLNEYLENNNICYENIVAAVRRREMFPCLFGSALNGDGVGELMRLIASVYDGCRASDANAASDTDCGEFGAYCYKITRDANGVRLSHLKITSGSIAVKEYIGEEKVNELRLYSGDKYVAAPQVSAGDIVVIPGLTATKPGVGYGTASDGIGASLEPVLSYAVRAADDTDRTQLLGYLRELEEELPELNVIYDEEHREIRASLMGEVQTEIITRLMLERFGVPVTFDVGSISYKETITDVVEGVGHFEPLRHYAEVHLMLEPGEPGSGMQLECDVSEDLLDRNWQRLIMTHLAERVHRGVLMGCPLTDVKITVIGGRAHPKHTEGGDFRQATYRAVRQGLMQAHSKVLEPYYDYTLEIPESMVGRAMTDIDRMNGTCIVSENVDGIAVLIGRAPVATMHTYGKDVLAYSGGEGRLTLSNGGYFDCHNEEEIVTTRGYNPDNDTRNPSWSVFCEHGAGVNIPWDEVFGRMHVEACMKRNADAGLDGDDWAKAAQGGMRPMTAPKTSGEMSIGTDEIDEIINRTAYSNRKNDVKAHKGISAARAADRRKTATHTESRTVEYKAHTPLPKYMLVDGYNVIFAWKELAELAAVNIDGARGRLLDIMDEYQSMIDAQIIVVFDAYRVQNHPTEYSEYNSIHVVYTRTAENADQYIERYTHEHGKKYDITVVTSDGLEQIIIRGQGCRLISSRELEEYVRGAADELRREHGLEE